MSTVTSVTKHFPSAEEGFTTTLASTVSSGATTVPLNSVAGYSNGEVVVFVVDPTNASKKQAFTGTIDTAGVQVTGVVWTEGTNQDHTAGSTVVDYATATHMSMVSKGILVSHGQDGHIATTGVATFTDHIDMADGKAIRDGNDNEVIKISQTASAVNEITVKNAATANDPEIQATGGDTNIGINLVPKGTGAVEKGGYPIDWWEELGRTTLGSAGDTITVNNIPARKYLIILANLTATGGNINALVRFNNDTGNNYSRRVSDNGAADSTATSASSIGAIDAVADGPVNVRMLTTNVAAQEKIIEFQGYRRGTAGAGNAPARREGLGKWANTSDQITRVDVINDSTGDFAIGSEVVVLGHN